MIKALNPAAWPAATPSLRRTLRQAVGMAFVFSFVVSLPVPAGVVLSEGWHRLPLALEWVWKSTLFSTVFVAAMLVVLMWGYEWIAQRGWARGGWRVVSLAVAATVLGLLVQWVFMQGHAELPKDVVHDRNIAYEVQRLLTISALFVFGYDHLKRARRSQDALHATRLQQLQLDRELAGARLQLLQAQVEPHFLFNTLANLRRLVRTEPTAARAMLADLMRYLAEALPSLRDQRSTLAREVALVQAYLALHQVRMGQRLQWTLQVPDTLQACEVPPMVLLTLVENAIKHGIAPQVAGGHITVSAALEHRAGADVLALCVADTGRGLVAGGGHGSGLANLRARLKALHGNAAVLTVQANAPQGVLARVVLPLTTAWAAEEAGHGR
jgi:signal transduction histidine kinase